MATSGARSVPRRQRLWAALGVGGVVAVALLGYFITEEWIYHVPPEQTD